MPLHNVHASAMAFISHCINNQWYLFIECQAIIIIITITDTGHRLSNTTIFIDM